MIFENYFYKTRCISVNEKMEIMEPKEIVKGDRSDDAGRCTNIDTMCSSSMLDPKPSTCDLTTEIKNCVRAHNSFSNYCYMLQPLSVVCLVDK